MNHGGIAYIGSDRIRLSEDLLRPLSIGENSSLTAVYYPRPTDERYRGVNFHHDLMLTPVPYRAWPFSAGIRLDIKHQKGSLATVTEFLKHRKVNILTGQCTRSAHRYATWDMVVEFEGLSDLNPPLVQLDGMAQRLEKEIEAFKTGIIAECGPVLQDSNSPYLRNPVEAWPLKPLAYFYKQSLKEETALYKPLKMRCTSSDSIEVERAKTVFWLAKIREELPTLGVARLDTDNFNIRIAIVGREDLRNFRSTRVEYSLIKETGRQSSLGLMHSLSEKLREDWNLWRIYNQTRRDSSQTEEGLLQVLMEYAPARRSSADIDQHAKGQLEAFSQEQKGLDIHFTVEKISPRRIFLSMRNEGEFKRHPDILHFCRELAAEIGVLPEDVVTVETYTNESVTNQVIETVESCTGMLQFYMGTGKGPSMDWLNTEYVLAFSRKIPCIRFVDPALRDRLIHHRDQALKLIDETAPDRVLKQAIREALHELDDVMRSRR
jgi:hypothetical protein